MCWEVVSQAMEASKERFGGGLLGGVGGVAGVLGRISVERARKGFGGVYGAAVA